MANVIQFAPKAKRPADCARALALMIEAQGLLEALIENGQLRRDHRLTYDSTIVSSTTAIGMLTPDDEEEAHG